MTRYEHMLRDLPAGLTEADLMDMVDGTVSAEREWVVIDALQARPQLGLLVKQLRMDRVGMTMLADFAETTPPNMLEAIEARLDRAALSALVHEAEEASAPIPISRVQPVGSGNGRGIIRLIAESVWARRLATAASIAIVGGLGVLGARELLRKWPRLPGSVPVATTAGGDPSPPAPAATVAGADGQQTGQPDMAPETTVASVDPTNIRPEPSDEPEHPLTAAEAIALAQEGRLVITVRTAKLEGTLKQLESLSRASASTDMRWRSQDPDRLPSELAMLAVPLPDPSLDPRPPMSPTFVGPSRPPAMASEGHGVAAQPPRHDESAWLVLDQPQVRVRAIRTVRMNADARQLEDLLSDLNVSKDAAAKFRVLPTPIAERPSLEPESVLWWASGSDSWTHKITLPIVVETVE